MDQKERDEILYRLDTRTESVDRRLGRMEKQIQQNQEELQGLDSRITRNEKDIRTGKGLLGILGTAISAITAKLVGLIQI